MESGKIFQLLYTTLNLDSSFTALQDDKPFLYYICISRPAIYRTIRNIIHLSLTSLLPFSLMLMAESQLKILAEAATHSHSLCLTWHDPAFRLHAYPQLLL